MDMPLWIAGGLTGALTGGLAVAAGNGPQPWQGCCAPAGPAPP